MNILLTDNILKAMNDKKITALVLLDLCKAFDSINHEKLLEKLSTIGASPSTVEWFRSYLSNRRQYVRINSTHSDSLPVTHGVPQGAIFLFIYLFIFIYFYFIYLFFILFYLYFYFYLYFLFIYFIYLFFLFNSFNRA